MNPQIHYTIGRRIRDIRKQQRISQYELAAWLQNLRAPITRSIIANWETGRSDVPAYCIQILAYLLEVKIAEILPDVSIKQLVEGQTMRQSDNNLQHRPQT